MDNIYSDDITSIETSFQDGCNKIVQAVTSKGSTPASNSVNDICTAIENISTGYSNTIIEYIPKKGSTKNAQISYDIPVTGLYSFIMIMMTRGVDKYTCSISSSGNNILSEVVVADSDRSTYNGDDYMIIDCHENLYLHKLYNKSMQKGTNMIFDITANDDGCSGGYSVSLCLFVIYQY